MSSFKYKHLVALNNCTAEVTVTRSAYAFRSTVRVTVAGVTLRVLLGDWWFESKCKLDRVRNWWRSN